MGFAGCLFAAMLVSSCRKQPVASTPPPPPFQPAVAAPAPTITLRATPASIERGSSLTLEWATSNAGSVRIEPGLGEVPVNGNRSVTPTSSVTYQATAIGPGGQASDVARITVTTPPPPPPTEAPLNPRPTTNADDIGDVKTVLFDYDKSEIRPDQIAILQTNAAWMRRNPAVRFTIEGHCDERGSQEYNLALGDHRANAVKEYLVSQGIAAARLNVISYGEERPICRDQSEDCMQRNRRAEFTKAP